MSTENQVRDQKSIRYVLAKQKDAGALACDCVGFANAAGGSIMLGIEDGQNLPSAGQRIPDSLPEQLVKRISQVSIGVGLVAQKRLADNGGEYVEIQVSRNAQSIASMSDGRFFIRVADETRRLLPDDLGRLLTEKQTYVWELQTARRVPRGKVDSAKTETFLARIRDSDRVSSFIKAKSDGELLEHYFLVSGAYLTNLGVLWIGQREDRAALLYAPVIQCIKFDEREQKVQKWTCDDYAQNPMEMIDVIWRDIPDWKQSYELPDGLFRKNIPHYDEVVVRELLANALVHRPYTQRGDIFLNLYPDRLEVHNPGLLPIGVTPQNILHASVKRNQHLANVFYALKLMEGEGSGFDKMYETLLISGRAAPTVVEGDDRVMVTVCKRIMNPQVMDFVTKADQTYSLTQRERIILGLLAQHEAVSAVKLVKLLELKNAENLRHWLGRLTTIGIVKMRGRTKGTEYLVEPGLLRKLEFKGKTTLRRIETHRLRSLVLQDLETYRDVAFSEIHDRIGREIPVRTLRWVLQGLTTEGLVQPVGERRGRRYLLTET